MTQELSDRLQAALGVGYRVERELGHGGFAIVYRVEDLKLKRKLAVKVVSPDLVASRTTLERFRREAETVAQLAHPNIVPLHFIGQSDDLLYLAMQCVEGGSLQDRLVREKRLPVADAVRVMTEVGSALAHAHRRGVTHRDIKPHNVLLDPESGRCLVTDFGIARTVDSSSLTATGVVMGTPAYLAPEQVTGEPSDHRADIYSLGVMGYEMLAGRPPFDGATPTAMMMKRLAGPPPSLSDANEDVSAELDQVIKVALAPEPRDRFQTADDLVHALTGASPVSGSRTTSAVQPRRSSSRRVPFALAGAAVLVAVAVLTPILSNREDGTPALPPVDAGMILVPGGTFRAGSDLEAAGLARPAHVVTLSAFGFDSTEVTVGAYKQYIDSTRFPAPWSGSMPDPRLPVTRVLWQEASNYCAWKHRPSGRLPTEYEWEAAASGAEGRAWPWGNQFERGLANTASAAQRGPAPVGSFPRSNTPGGAQDLLGNAWEWTSSPPAPYPGSAASAQGGLDTLRVIRGGAFDTPDEFATLWRRVAYPVTTNRIELEKTGFRCAMDARSGAGG